VPASNIFLPFSLHSLSLSLSSFISTWALKALYGSTRQGRWCWKLKSYTHAMECKCKMIKVIYNRISKSIIIFHLCAEPKYVIIFNVSELFYQAYAYSSLCFLTHTRRHICSRVFLFQRPQSNVNSNSTWWYNSTILSLFEVRKSTLEAYIHPYMLS
jgi:hypothetical protein